ncbi:MULTISPECIES: hypothetical protein [Cysteiniphilum]|uniref:hypothetical protein n=1 Tax=Cysteiniphilum TaxID=2056696 RepID=UPI001785DE79|nr:MULTISPECIES: hypothetical protein [Cysteiniphilum]
MIIQDLVRRCSKSGQNIAVYASSIEEKYNNDAYDRFNEIATKAIRQIIEENLPALLAKQENKEMLITFAINDKNESSFSLESNFNKI